MQDAQRETNTKHTPVSNTPLGAFVGTAAAIPVVPRTLALMGAICLVAFALYLTRPDAKGTNVERSLHASSTHNGSVGPAAIDRVEAQDEENAWQSTATNASIVQTTTQQRVTVNGQDIPVPDDGNLHKTITEGEHTTTIDISTTGDSDSTSTTSNISVHSNSSSPDARP